MSMLRDEVARGSMVAGASCPCTPLCEVPGAPDPVRAPKPGPKAAVLAELSAAGFAVPAFEYSPDDLPGAMRRLGAPLAVRSCASVEDGGALSFAGQFRTVLNVRTPGELERAVAACRASAEGEAVRAYCRRSGLDAAAVRVGVIVQRMVEAELAGVAFSVDPVTGEDRVVIEACEGVGDGLLAGRREPIGPDDPKLRAWRPRIERLARDVQRHFGSPRDIEFAVDRRGLWLLQARPITRIGFAPGVGEWTTADFRDGGVSASVCSPLMWSLYERAWEGALVGFLREVHLLGRGERFEAGRMFFGRPYWNLGEVKRCLAKLPGYVERRFDEDLSVEPCYEGEGEVTGMTPGRIAGALRTGWAVRRFFREQEAVCRWLLGGGFEAMARRYEARRADPVAALRRLVEREFARTECAYFRTIFAASLAKLDFQSAFPEADTTALVAGVGPLRHMAPVREMRRMARAGVRDVEGLLRRYRHHHPSGLDVIHPRWDEQRGYVERLLGVASASVSAEAEGLAAVESAAYARARHLARLPRRRRGAFNRKLDRLRRFLYLREEMRDCSGRLYYVIRRCALEIAERRALGDGVFFMTAKEVLDDDRSKIETRRDVYERYRRFEAPHEIGRSRAYEPESSRPALGGGSALRGLGASRGRVRGTARVVRSAAEASHIGRGAVLVCPFTDPGWTAALDRAAAVVTETGGLLSHAAVICREFGVPAVLGVAGAMGRIRDGAAVEVDGDRGEVRLLDSGSAEPGESSHADDLATEAPKAQRFREGEGSTGDRAGQAPPLNGLFGARGAAAVGGRIEERASFEGVRYANCWEDADVVCEALRPGAGRRVLSIASAGDNALALLGEGAEVVAADVSAGQLACLELRCAAFRRLDYEAMLAFLGARPCADRPAVYRRLEGDLSEAGRRHWRANARDVAGGIIHAGRFERYFGVFRRWVLPLIHRRGTVEALLAEKPAEERRRFYDLRWNNRRWRALFRVFFGRVAMGRLGRDPEFFRYVEGGVGERLLARVEHGLRHVPGHDNPYLRYILTGNFGPALPRYLRPGRFEAIREGLGRLTLYHGPIEGAARAHGAEGFDAFNLSDIFEYLDAKTCGEIYGELLATARPGARLAYWNTLVGRRCPERFAGRVTPLDRLATDLHGRDRAFFYCDFIVDRFHGNPQEAPSCIEPACCC